MTEYEPDFIAWEYCGILSEKPMGNGAEPVKLYRHPAKTLTDKEKWKLWGECPHGLVYDRVMMFADLILRKAQEK